MLAMIVDDSRSSLLHLQQLTERDSDVHAMAFLDPEAALDAAKQHRFDMVIVDNIMPKVDGIEVLRRLKADQEFRKLPVIMLTTTDDSREVERCHQLGCNGYIQKPVDYDKFAEAIRRIGLFLPLLLVPALGAP